MKRKKTLGVFTVFVFLAIASIYFFSTTPEEPRVLTTNIDLANKTINDPGETTAEERNGAFTGIIQTIVDSLSVTIRDDMSMLAAAANPSVKFVRINPGMRKEEIANLIGSKLDWNDTDEEQFLNLNKVVNTTSAEGYYYPDVYILPAKASGQEIGRLMVSRFNSEVMSRYASSTKKIISVDTATKIASIIEREAAGKSDMRLISGIMWNRIFKNMTLDIDATLQYAKGSETDGWWPKVKSGDRFIDSPYNTYQNKGLTPTPISNPQLASIEAALNPKKTDCLFYLHDKYRRIHCTVTYGEHVKNIARYYGK